MPVGWATSVVLTCAVCEVLLTLEVRITTGGQSTHEKTNNRSW